MFWLILFIVVAILFGLGSAVHIAVQLLWLLLIVAVLIALWRFITGRNTPRL